MQVRWLELLAFRNYASLSFIPDPGLNVLVGRNAQGKTSLLEALHILLTGRSFRTAHLGECVGWGAAEAVIAGEVAEAQQRRRLRLTVSGEGRLGAETGLCRWARAVTFSAPDLLLLTGPPQARRAYLDGAAAKLVPLHGESCRRYRLALIQRGHLLAGLLGRGDVDRLLAPWDEQIAALGSEIVHRRIEAVAALGQDMRVIWEALVPGGAPLVLEYVSQVAPGPRPDATRARLLDALVARRRDELQRKVTLVGPHRDDLVIRLGAADARSSASRGEQRLLVLALRLGEARAVARRAGIAPVLLLDDLLSELDLGARERVLAWLAVQGQVIFSATDAAVLAGEVGAMWAVDRAEVEAVEPVLVGRTA